MAEFKLNNGNPVELKIDSKFDLTKIYVSVDIIPDSNVIKLAGMTYIKCINEKIKDVIFKDYPLDYSCNLYNETLIINADATKFKVIQTNLNPETIPVKCELTIEAGDNLLVKYVLDDNSNCTYNSEFIFKINFIK